MKYYNKTEIADKMAFTRQWLYKLIQNGKIKMPKPKMICSGIEMYGEGDVNKLIERYKNGKSK